jgi:hypothetical protein
MRWPSLYTNGLRASMSPSVSLATTNAVTRSGRFGIIGRTRRPRQDRNGRGRGPVGFRPGRRDTGPRRKPQLMGQAGRTISFAEQIVSRQGLCR